MSPPNMLDIPIGRMSPGEYEGQIIATTVEPSFCAIKVRMDDGRELSRNYPINIKVRLENDLIRLLGEKFKGNIGTALAYLEQTKPRVEFTIDQSGKIDIFIRIIAIEDQDEDLGEQEQEHSPIMEAAPETQEQEDIEEYGGQILKYDDHYYKRIISKNVRCRECTEQGELLPTYCLMPSSGYGHRWGLTFEEAQNKLRARKQGKPPSEC